MNPGHTQYAGCESAYALFFAGLNKSRNFYSFHASLSQRIGNDMPIAKPDDKHLAFGWANVAIRADGEEIEDWQEDIIEPEELENAAYQYVLLYREGGEMHERGGAAVLVESVVFTEEKMQAMGIPAGTLPIGWWIGFKVTDKDVWEKVKDGTYPMFSIEGEAERVEVEDENTL